MSRSSEEILLQVKHVRHKKNDGTLYVMAERIGWMIENRSAFSVNHKYTEIKSQKISPEGKAKIQLQIVLHDGTTNTTFHFANPRGIEAQIRDRDSVKDLLHQLLPKFKKKVNKELEEKNRLLSENPGLLQLYKDLVITQVLTAEEFWSQHAQTAKAKTGLQKQEVGVSGSFLADIKPQADGANGLKYNLTGDIIESIFKTYPAVKRKHFENVPQKMTEQDFWTKFFQSHYFHRDRIHGHGVKDLFTECAKDDEKIMKAQLKAGVSDPVANLANFSDKTLDENYGVQGEEKTANIVHQNIIKRFNQHSIMIMDVTGASNPAASENGQSSASEAETKQARKRLLEKVSYEDLAPEPPKKAASLNLAKIERYLNGPTPVNPSDYLTTEEIIRSRHSMLQELTQWSQGQSSGVLSAKSAVSVLGDLSPGGALMKGSRQESLAGQCPESVQNDLRQLYSSLCELIRHFWECFPPTTPQLQDKATKMHDTLHKFHQVKLKPFENELLRQYTTGAQLTNHLNQMLEAAYRKYSTWHQRKSR